MEDGMWLRRLNVANVGAQLNTGGQEAPNKNSLQRRHESGGGGRNHDQPLLSFRLFL